MEEAPHKSRRRWFQFGIGTMLALTALAAVLAWEMAFIYRRQDAKKTFSKIGVEVVEWENINPVFHKKFRQASIPWWRRMLGDRAVSVVNFPREHSKSEVDDARSYFPEATIEIGEHERLPLRVGEPDFVVKP
jgi:hypothetical protein